MVALDTFLSERLEAESFGSSIDRFVFCFEIADSENWGKFFGASAAYTSYRPKSKEIWSVGQARWTEVKDLEIGDQISALRGAIRAAIERVGAKSRKPKDFAFAAFASAVDALLERAPEDQLRQHLQTDPSVERRLH